VKARVDELQRQLQKLGGKGESTTVCLHSQTNQCIPPSGSCRCSVSLRRPISASEDSEAVLETLHKEYELAKVQEAKEFQREGADSAVVPDKKSFPPRLLIIFLGRPLLSPWPYFGFSEMRPARNRPERPAQALRARSFLDGVGWIAVSVAKRSRRHSVNVVLALESP